jgi:hypothetical protein
MPQLSLANPAVGKAQLDYEVKRTYDDVLARIQEVRNLIPSPDTGGAFDTLDILVGDLTLRLDEPLIFWSSRTPNSETLGQDIFMQFNNGVDSFLANSDYDTRYRLTAPIVLNGINVNLNPALLGRPEVTELLGNDLEKLSNVRTTLLVKYGVHGGQINPGMMHSFYIDGDFSNASPEVPIGYSSDLESFMLADKDRFDDDLGLEDSSELHVPVTTSMGGGLPIGRYTKYCISFFGDSEKSKRQVGNFSTTVEVPIVPINNTIVLHAAEAFKNFAQFSSYASIEGIKFTRY